MGLLYAERIGQELQIKDKQVEAVMGLLEDGGTVPFIARYRKEVTGMLDEVAVMGIRDRWEQLQELDKRREAILASLEQHGHLNDELKGKVRAAETMVELEDIYLPYRPKRRTRATIAKEKGLEPLAIKLREQENFEVEAEAAKYIDKEKEVHSAEEALAGARDIIAEWMSEDKDTRERLRDFYTAEGMFVSKLMKDKEEEGAKFKDYFDWQEPIKSAPSHRVLAMRRGEAEKVLTLRILVPEERAAALVCRGFVKADNAATAQVKLAGEDSFKRLLSLSMQTELRLESKKQADEEAIRVFAENLRQLLLAAPLGQKNMLAVDPAFRTGCKIVCLDKQGKLLHNDVIYPHSGSNKAEQGAALVRELCQQFSIEAVAIGNGTASRETEAFIRGAGLGKEIMVVMVNESGASVYSASEAAREEFGEYDLTVRGAVSIGRRLMDPLAELVKIDPKSIGVGQYQHDVDQTALKKKLDDVVVSCVNNVGVEVNTASKQLLTYVSGLGPVLAQNIVNYRNENGPFQSRTDLKKVTRLGSKAFEQAAGFLRIRGGKNPLDGSAVHPESYKVVDEMAQAQSCTVMDLMRDGQLRNKIDLQKYVTDKFGLPTLTDIMGELSKPGRDPREKFEIFSFAEGVEKIEDLEEGMKLPGIVTNITAFGAFVDIGVHQDGLVHISELADEFVKDPADHVKVHQKVWVIVMSIDIPRKRIALSMKNEPGSKPVRKANVPQVSQPRPNKKPRPKASSGGGLTFGDMLSQARKK